MIRLVRRWYDSLSLGGSIRLRQPIVLIAGPLLLVLALVSGYRWLFFMAYTALLVPTLTYWWVRVLAVGISLGRTPAASVVQVGGRVSEFWHLHNQTVLPVVWLTIDDQTTLPDHAARRATGAGPHERARWEVRTYCGARGHYQFGPATITIGDPLGLFEARWPMPETVPIAVYPPMLALPTLAIPGGRRNGTTRTNLLHYQTTPSTGTVRPYQQGDVPSRIHWPSSVRRQELMVKAFDQEQAGAIYLLIDLAARAHYRTAGGHQRVNDVYAAYNQHSIIDQDASTIQFTATVELTVALASSLAAALLSEGRVLGLQTTGAQPGMVTPDRGMRQQWRIQEVLVGATDDGPRTLAEALPTLTRQTRDVAQAAVVLVTPDVSGEWVTALAPWVARGAASVVVAGATREAARPLEQQLSRTGTPLLVIPLEESLRLLNTPETTPARRSPFGRMITPVR